MDISFITLRDRACDEAYRVFGEKLRELPKNPDGSIHVSADFHDNDIDAFRHAHVSGVMMQEFGVKAIFHLQASTRRWNAIKADF